MTFVGKLIVSKGIDLLLAAWPLVLAEVPEARLVVIGFGAYREACERLVEALSAGDLAALRELAAAGAPRRAARGAAALPAAFLDWLRGGGRRRPERYLAPPGMRDRVLFTGRLEHDEVADVLPVLRGDGRAEHVPGVVRDGRRRGGGVRRAAGQRRPLGPGRGLARARRSLPVRWATSCRSRCGGRSSSRSIAG